MTDKNVKCLPPLVEGDVYGYLKVTIDEVLWSGHCPGDVAALMQWWGDIDSISLRPSDVSKYPEKTKEDSSVLYYIQTNLQLFEAYLKQCNTLKLIVIHNSSKEIVGHVNINNLLELITGIQYQQYFPIITSSGSRVGDLRVDFELTMNSVPEERASKKIRKRSRRKNKSNQGSYRQIDEEDNSKQIKRGCKSCSEYTKITTRSTVAENKLNLEPLKTPNTCKVPPNSQRSDSSECALWEVLDKSKKLRDAMMLSVLDEDSPDYLNEKLLLEPESEVVSKATYEPLKVKQNGEVASLYEETLINKYIEGKAMKEEEEILVLNALHGSDLKTTDTIGENKEVCCPISKSSRVHSAPKQRTEHISEPEAFMTHTCGSSDMNKLLDKVNCFRLTIDNLTLTKAGWKKINQAVDSKNRNCEVPPPGATYFVECHFVEDSPRSVTQLWKTTPLRFCSRRQIENVVYFGQSCAQSLRPQAHLEAELAAASCVVCWRHLHQRVPARLGSFSLADLLLPSDPTLHSSATLAVLDCNSTVAHLRLSLTLGRDKLFYGEDLLNEIQEDKEIKKISIEDTKVQITGVPLKVADLSGNATKLTQTPFNRHLEITNMVIPQCSNCSQILALSGHPSVDSTLCMSCTELLAPHQTPSTEPNFTLSIPENFNCKEQRHHKYLIGIDSIIGFPLFAGVKEDVSCYVDYKFPEITSGLKATMSQRETTSRVVACEPQVTLSSVHAHHLPLPVALPLSPLLDACSPGVTLRLWLRYYLPSPRDHMVAMALLPMDDLCLLELEFDQKQQKSAVSKVLELPLALVPSSVTAPYQQYRNLGVLRVAVTYSNLIKSQQAEAGRDVQFIQEAAPWKITPVNVNQSESKLQPGERRGEVVPIDTLLDQITATNNEDLRIAKNRFWTGPFEKERSVVNKLNVENKPVTDTNKSSEKPSYTVDPLRNVPASREEVVNESSQPVMKEDFDILAESLEQRFNQLQSDLLKKKQQELSEQVNTVGSNLGSLMNDVNDDGILAFNSLSSNSSMESLPFILGPPADFKDTQNTVVFSLDDKLLGPSETLSEKSNSDTISGFLREEKQVANLGSNETIERDERKFEPINPKTFKAKIKIDRAVNLKAIRGPCNGKKGKVPPSTWVSFGTGGCCEQDCGAGNGACSGVKYNTPVVRKNYNPVWNLAWDVDLPVDYLTKINKRLVFRVFEENLDVAFGFASANVSILTSGLPSLSSWLSINDLTGACKGQIKIIVTPLEDVSKYQDCSVFDTEEDEFEEFHEKPEISSAEDIGDTTCFVASQTEIFLNKSGSEASNNADKEVERFMQSSDKGNTEDAVEEEDHFSADDVISDYKNTLENNFRNEMAGLDNLIKFLRVGSMSNELSFLQSTENKENLSYNPNFHQPNSDIKASSYQSVCNESSGQCDPREKVLVDASTETSSKEKPPHNTCHSNSEDILSKLLQQISMFQLPTVKISDNTCQTVHPETRETFTETNDEKSAAVDRTVHMKDATTETEESCDSSPPHSDDSSQQPHVCGELGSVLLQHFLTCKPATVKVTDNSSQTESQRAPLSADSSGVFMSSCMSSGILRNNPPCREDLTEFAGNWVTSETAPTNSERLIAIDNNIKDLELFLKQNLILTERGGIPPVDSIEGSQCGSLNGAKQDSQLSSDVQSSESYSQQLVLPRETPDGGSVSTLANNDVLGPTLRRRGTYVIQQSNSYSEETCRRKESGGDDAA